MVLRGLLSKGGEGRDEKWEDRREEGRENERKGKRSGPPRVGSHAMSEILKNTLIAKLS